MVYYLSHPAILHTLCTKHPETCHFHLFSVSPPPNSESRPIVSAFGTLSPVQERTTSWNARHCPLTVPAIIRPNLIIASSIDSYPSSNYSNESSSNPPYDSTLLLATAAVAVAHPYIPSSSAHHNPSHDSHSHHSIFTPHSPSFMCNHIRFSAPTLLRHRNSLNRGPLSSMAADAGLYPHRLDTFGALFFSPPLCWFPIPVLARPVWDLDVVVALAFESRVSSPSPIGLVRLRAFTVVSPGTSVQFVPRICASAVPRVPCPRLEASLHTVYPV